MAGWRWIATPSRQRPQPRSAGARSGLNLSLRFSFKEAKYGQLT